MSVALAALLASGLLADAPATPPPWLEPERARRWEALASEDGALRTWTYGWSGFLGAVVVGQSVVAATSDLRGARINAYWNIGASGVGLLATALRPPPAAWGLDRVRRMPEATPDERAAKAEALDALFTRASDEERFYRSPWNHALGLGVNAGLAAVLWFGYRLGGRALLTLGAGSVVWEAQILTHAHAADRLARERGEQAGRRLELRVVPMGTGVALVGTF